MNICSFFSGIGGLEFGFHKHGIEPIYFNEIDSHARQVLSSQYHGVQIDEDIRLTMNIPKVDILTAGFPCQDVSLAGPKGGFTGARTVLINEIFRLISKNSPKDRPKYLVFENVAYMLKLGRGSAIEHITSELEHLGYSWAYRVLDARSFGLPQRRHRFVLVASREEAPERILFPEDYGTPPVSDQLSDVNINLKRWYGFYWTEGKRGLGWAESSVPPIKGGSTIGIPSPPAVWQPEKAHFGTITIQDTERLQGFPAGWTDVFDSDKKAEKARWRLLGNAVCTSMSDWLAVRILNPSNDIQCDFAPFKSGKTWPNAAFGRKGKHYEVVASKYPTHARYQHLKNFLSEPLKPLSYRAVRGYYSRVIECSCRPPERFISDLEDYIGRVSE
jgi:DNA (cytosine-5)-methyltransferase 1